MFSKFRVRVMALLMGCLFLNSFVAYSIGKKADTRVPSTEAVGVSPDELRQINEEFAKVNAEFKKELPALQEINKEFKELLKEIDLQDLGLFKNFRNRLLVDFSEKSEVSFGIYGADLIKFLSLMISVYIDKMLFDSLSSYYHNAVVSNFDKKRDLLIALYNEKVAYRDIENFLQDSRSLNSFIDECVNALDFNTALNPKLFSYIFFNLLEKEGLSFFEHQIFPTGKTGLLGLINKFKEVDETVEKNKKYTFSAYTFSQWLLKIGIFGIQPLLHDILQESIILSYRIAGWNYQFLNSYSFDLTKRMTILVLFLKRLNIWQASLFKNYLKTNMQIFIKTLSDSQDSKKYKDSDDAADVDTVADEALKSFLNSGMDCSFKQWFDYKNSCSAKFGFLIEGIILAPVLCKGGVFCYNNFIREG